MKFGKKKTFNVKLDSLEKFHSSGFTCLIYALVTCTDLLLQFLTSCHTETFHYFIAKLFYRGRAGSYLIDIFQIYKYIVNRKKYISNRDSFPKSAVTFWNRQNTISNR